MAAEGRHVTRTAYTAATNCKVQFISFARIKHARQTVRKPSQTGLKTPLLSDFRLFQSPMPGSLSVVNYYCCAYRYVVINVFGHIGGKPYAAV